MKYNEHSFNSGEFKLPQTQVTTYLNDQLILVIRSWTGSDHIQTVIDEITRFLSAADAELEVTTPFDYLESLSTIANKVRIALLLANDAIYTHNKDKYLFGFEVAICFKSQREIVVASMGRFSIQYEKNHKIFNLYQRGGLIDESVLLPPNLLGIDKTPQVDCYSLSVQELDEIDMSSYYSEKTFWKIKIDQFS